MRVKIPFIGPTYKGKSSNINAQRCINLIPEIDPSNDRNVMSLIGRPGYNLFATLGALPMRGGITVGDVLYTASGFNFYSVLPNGTFTTIGTLLSNSGRISIADNGTQVMVVDGTYGYIYNISTGVFTRITAAGFTSNPTTVTFQDGYFIVSEGMSGRFHVSALYDGLTWSALDFATAEANPDNLITVKSFNQLLYLFGDNTTEIWYNAGTLFPFARQSGGVMGKGIAARFSLSILEEQLYWLAQDKNGKGYVVRASGFQPERISTPALEYQIASYGDVSDAVGFGFIFEGHPLYVLSFTKGNATWVFDVSTGLWAEWQSYGVGRFKGEFYAFLSGKHIIGDFVDGDVYELKSDVYTDNGDPIQAIRTGNHLSKNGKWLIFSQLVIDMETGVGIDGTGQGINPQAMLRWSDDGGHTWSSELWVTMGKIGEYRKRATWNRLGKSRDRVFEVMITDPVKRVIIDAYADVKEGIF